MKCVCGYQHGEIEWESGKLVNPQDQGIEDFIRVNGMFTVENSGYYSGERQVYIYACPKCKTIQLCD